MRSITIAFVCLLAAACGEPESKDSSNNSSNDPNNTANNSGSNNAATNNSGGNNAETNNAASNATNSVSTNNNGNNEPGGVGDVCDADNPCQTELRCQSAEERSWNFCGAPMEPDCAETEVGDSCGNCFIACVEDADCGAPMTCNGTYCIGERTCGEEVQPPP